MSRKPKTHLVDLIEKLDPEVLNLPVQAWRGRSGYKKFCLALADGPLKTSQVLKKFGTDRSWTGERLGNLVIEGLVEKARVKSEFSRLEFSLNETVLREKARQKSRTKSHLKALPRNKQDALNEADWKAKGFKEHAAWRNSEVCAIFDRYPKCTPAELGRRLAVDRQTARKMRDRLVDVGALKFRERKLKGKTADSEQWWEVRWDRIEKWRSKENAGRKLGPTRAVNRLSERSPKKDYRTRDQICWCDVLTAVDVGIKGYAWSCFKVIASAVDPSGFTTRTKVARELGGGRKAIDRALPAIKKRGLLEIKINSGGEHGRESQWIFNWPEIEQLAGVKAQASTNGQAKSRSNGAAKKKAVSKPEPVKPFWDAKLGQLSLGNDEWAVAKQAKRIREVLDELQKAGWPIKIATPFPGNPQAHKDAIRGLKKIGTLGFSSTLSGTFRGWKEITCSFRV